MDRRLELSDKLRSIIGNDNVYFQPPSSTIIQYPCVIYNERRGSTTYANDSVYNYVKSYEIKFIFKKLNESIVKNVLKSLTLCSFDRVYIADNLYHYVFIVHY